MSRNGSGTYSLPAGNPVTSGTNISSTWANDTLSDIETEMTSSLDRNGKGGMLAALRGTDGTVSAPALSWTSETGSGFYRASAGVVAFTILGTKTATFNASGITLEGALATDTISEKTAAAGVTVDGVVIKDAGLTATGTVDLTGATVTDGGTVTTIDIDGGTIDGAVIGGTTPAAITGTTVDGTTITASTSLVSDTVAESTPAAGVTVDGVLLKDGEVTTDTINEESADAGVTIDGVLLKDGGATVTGDIDMGNNALEGGSAGADADNIISAELGAMEFSQMGIAASNMPNTASNNANGVLSISSDANYGKQLGWIDTDDLYVRKLTNSVWGSWYKIHTTANTTLTETDQSETITADWTFSGATTFTEIIETTGTMPAGTTPSIDPANGTVQDWTLSGVSTPTEALEDGESVCLHIAGTAHTITWTAVDLWVNGSTPDLDATDITIVQLWKVGTTTFGALVGVASAA